MLNKAIESRLIGLERQRRRLILHNLRGEPLQIYVDRLERITAHPDTRLFTGDGRSWLVRESPEEVVAMVSGLHSPHNPAWAQALAKRLGYCIGELSWERQSATAGRQHEIRQVAWGMTKPRRSLWSIYARIFSQFKLFGKRSTT
ncbi:MAG: Flagellar and Swarming motility protein [Verrucomicrobiota bacterium]|jgi:uncharacterized protein YlzI (FlbEa/FlbD family)